ncbi:MAG: dienelactone hydrolase family protein [Pyrinomonadaceae bacterium]|nr:dienelactone hydrolase family protein [Pyrinomonadaceae bacterium]
MAGEIVEFESNGTGAQGYLSLPAGGGKAPGIIVIQEWWGLVSHIKDVADRFAAAGFVALAPDLYHGETTKSPDEAGKLMMALKIDEAERDLRGAINYLIAHERIAGEKVGMIGFCMGGALSLYAATKNERVGACVVFYGAHPKVTYDLENLRAPVLGIFAEKDDFATPKGARELQTEIESLGKLMELHVYKNADHAFFNDHRPEVYQPDAAEDAWRRTLAFFRENLPVNSFS